MIFIIVDLCYSKGENVSLRANMNCLHRLRTSAAYVSKGVVGDIEDVCVISSLGMDIKA